MPREFRKRGKGGASNKKTEPLASNEDGHYDQPNEAYQADGIQPPIEFSPSMQPNLDEQQIGRSTAQEPYPADDFPVLTPDLRAYWKEINEKLLELERLGYHPNTKNSHQQEEDEDEDEDERALLLRTAFSELNGQELALACDPETAVILERIIFSMDGFAMRVLLDRLIVRFVDLCHHRNASHAIQTLLVVSAPVLEQEARLELSSKKANEPKVEHHEDLPTLTDLLSQACEDMLEHLESLSCSPSACHVLLTIFLLCFGKPMDQEDHRSKKSRQWRSKQAPFRSAPNQRSEEPKHEPTPVSENAQDQSTSSTRQVPGKLRRQGDCLYSQLRKNWCDKNGLGVRSMASNPATVVLLKLMIELEFDKGDSEVPGSLTDIILDGLFQTIESTADDRSDFVEVSLRDVTASRVIEGILSRLSAASFQRFHHIYLLGRLGHLCGHPVANFIITKAVARLDEQIFLPALAEFKLKMIDCIDNYRTGFFKALVDRSVSFGEKVQEEVIQTILKAFGIESESEYRWIFPCMISLMRLDYFRKTTSYNLLDKASEISQDELKLPESNIQGSLLLQAILNSMPGSVNKIMDKAVKDLPLEVIIGFSRDSISSRALDSLLNSPSVNSLTRFRFILRFLGKFHELADDRIGSHVAEACWAASDVYLKEKIANSLVSPNDQPQMFLQKSSYGHFFLKKLELPLFQRQREAWKAKMKSKTRSQPELKQLNPQLATKSPHGKPSTNTSIPALQANAPSPSPTNSDGNPKTPAPKTSTTDRKKKAAKAEGNKKPDQESAVKTKKKKNKSSNPPPVPDPAANANGQVVQKTDQQSSAKNSKKRKNKPSDLPLVIDQIDEMFAEVPLEKLHGKNKEPKKKKKKIA